jgi:hypothetical protein
MNSAQESIECVRDLIIRAGFADPAIEQVSINASGFIDDNCQKSGQLLRGWRIWSLYHAVFVILNAPGDLGGIFQRTNNGYAAAYLYNPPQLLQSVQNLRKNTELGVVTVIVQHDRDHPNQKPEIKEWTNHELRDIGAHCTGSNYESTFVIRQPSSLTTLTTTKTATKSPTTASIAELTTEATALKALIHTLYLAEDYVRLVQRQSLAHQTGSASTAGVCNQSTGGIAVTMPIASTDNAVRGLGPKREEASNARIVASGRVFTTSDALFEPLCYAALGRPLSLPVDDTKYNDWVKSAHAEHQLRQPNATVTPRSPQPYQFGSSPISAQHTHYPRVSS